MQPLPRQTTQFVHGVPDSFLRVGERKAQAPEDGEPRFTRGAYFMGKAVWAKVCLACCIGLTLFTQKQPHVPAAKKCRL